MTEFWSTYGKSIVAFAGFIAAPAATYLGHEWWWALVMAGLTFAGVHVAPAGSRMAVALPAEVTGAGVS